MSFYDRYDRRGRNHHSVLGYWVPLVLTVTAATAGAVAWIWSERQNNDSDDEDDTGRYQTRPGQEPAGPAFGPRPNEPGYAPGAGAEHRSVDEEGFMARMSGAIRRTPSPQQFFDSAGRKVAAGMAAAGAVVGGALSAIREEDKDDFGDHSRWSEEATKRNVAAQSSQSRAAVAANVEGFNSALRSGPASSSGPVQGRPGVRRKTIAVVVSAESSLESLHSEEQSSYKSVHASILSHLPEHIDPSVMRVFVLIFAPDLKSYPRIAQGTAPSASGSYPAPSITSSYSVINTPAQTPGEELTQLEPHPYAPSAASSAGGAHTPAMSATTAGGAGHEVTAEGQTPLFTALYGQASALVEHSTMILPFTTSTGHVHLLRHLAPDIVYIAEALSGAQGEVVQHIKGWVGQVVVVVGDAGGTGGLADTEDEGEGEGPRVGSKWWESADFVGLGKGVEIVDSVRVGDDWARRLGGRD